MDLGAPLGSQSDHSVAGRVTETPVPSSHEAGYIFAQSSISGSNACSNSHEAGYMFAQSSVSGSNANTYTYAHAYAYT